MIHIKITIVGKQLDEEEIMFLRAMGFFIKSIISVKSVLGVGILSRVMDTNSKLMDDVRREAI